MDFEHIVYYGGAKNRDEDIVDLFGFFNEHNLGKAGDSKGMVFALDEMKKYYG